MTVYVDEPRHPLGRMLMCHMVADSRAELEAMAHRIGVNPRHTQHAGTPKEHLDISKGKRKLAVRYGAVEVSSRELVQIVRGKGVAFPARSW